MKVAELEGAGLDAWVARAEGATVHVDDWTVLDFPGGRRVTVVPNTRNSFTPSIDWALAGPLIEREKITVIEGRWGIGFRACVCFCYDFDLNDWIDGDTYLTAAMRAYVASKFGDEVADGDKP